MRRPPTLTGVETERKERFPQFVENALSWRNTCTSIRYEFARASKKSGGANLVIPRSEGCGYYLTG